MSTSMFIKWYARPQLLQARKVLPSRLLLSEMLLAVVAATLKMSCLKSRATT